MRKKQKREPPSLLQLQTIACITVFLFLLLLQIFHSPIGVWIKERLSIYYASADPVPEPARFASAKASAILNLDTEWICPLETGIISSPYGWRVRDGQKKASFHSGIDVAAAQGSVVFAAADGMVTQALRSDLGGNTVRLQHGAGWETMYLHLEYIYVHAGDVVLQGQPLGTIGETGNATGPHLHFELLYEGDACDPTALFAAL